MKLPVNIKKKQSTMPIYSAIGLIMLCIALFCLFTPFIPPFSTKLSKDMQLVYMIIGGIGTMFFAFATSYTVFNIISPPVGVTISDEGIYEYTVAGCGAGFIPKEAIISLKTFGKDKRQYLGINISPQYISDLGEGNAAKKEIAHNMEAGIPAVIIRQSDVYITVSKMLKLITEAYGTEDAVSTKPVFEASKVDDVEIQAPLPTPEEKAEDTVIDTQTSSHETSATPIDLTIKTALSGTNATIKSQQDTHKDQTVEWVKEQKTETSHSQNVIKTVDELLEKLNISSKPRGN